MFEKYFEERLGAKILKSEHSFLVYVIAGETCHLQEIYTDSDFREQGEGKKLFDLMLDIAREAGCKNTQATIYPRTNGSSVALHGALHIGYDLKASTQDFILLERGIH